MEYNQTDKVQIRFNDIDLLGHVNNAIISEYFDLGRMNYIHRVFGGSIKFNDDSLVIVSIQMQFFKQIFLNDSIEVKTKIYSIGRKSLKMKQVIVNQDGEIYAESLSVLVAIAVETKESIEVPPQWRELILSLDPDCKNEVIA